MASGDHRGSASGDAPRQHYAITFAVLALGGASFSLLQSLVSPALPVIQHELHATESSVTWILTAYLLSAAVATPILGRLGDIYGKERMFVIAVGALGAGSAVAAVASSLELLIVGRVIQGLGGAVFPLAFGIIRDEFPPEKIAGGIALISAILGIGGALGMVIAGPIVDHLSYHWLFWLPLGVCAIAALGAHFFVPESPNRSPGRIDAIGGLLLSAWLVAVLVAISQGPQWGWGSPRTLGLLGAGIALAVVWVLAELQVREPLVDMAMMRLPSVWTVNLTAFLIGAGMFTSFALIPQFVSASGENGYGFDASVTEAGLFMLPMAGAMLVVGPIAGWLARTVGSRVPLILGALACVAGFAMLTGAHHERWEIYVAVGAVGAGIGLAYASLANLIVEAVPASMTGVATGINTVTRTVGGSVGGQVAASVLAGSVAASGVPEQSGYTTAFALAAGFCVIATLAALAVPRRGSARAAATAPHVALPGLTPAIAGAGAGAANGNGGATVEHVVALAEDDHRAARLGGGTAASVGEADSVGGATVGARDALSGSAGADHGGSHAASALAPDPDLAQHLGRAGRVHGRIRRGGGIPAPAAVVTLLSGAREVGRGVADADGRFELDELPAGSYVAVVAAPGHQPQAHLLRVAGTVELDVELEAHGLGGVRGTVRVGADGPPLPDVPVTVTDANGRVIASARSDAAGDYHVDGLVEGEYTVTAGALGPTARPLTVSPGADAAVDLPLD